MIIYIKKLKRILTSSHSLSGTQLWRHRIATIANSFKTMTFAIADEDKNSDLWKEFGFADSAEEINVGILGPDDKKYPMEPMDNFEDDAVLEFLDDFNEGEWVNFI